MSVVCANVDELKRIIETGDEILVDIWATWCMPCRVMGPVFEDLSDKYANVKFIKVEANEENHVADFFDVKSVPTFLFFKGSKLVRKKGGMMSSDELEKMMDSSED